MHHIGYPVTVVNDVPVVTAPAEIDLTTAGQLRQALLQAATDGHTTIVVDMTRTRFCDSTGLTVLVRAHQRALAEGGELRLAIPAGSAVFRIFAITRLDRVIPHFGTMAQALSPARRGDPAAEAAPVPGPA
jgi:anti-sigma B factor antagonist